MTPFYLPRLVVLLEGLKNTESVVRMMKSIAQSISSNVRGVGNMGTLVRRVVQQLMGQHDGFK
jgi:hypothetical protein